MMRYPVRTMTSACALLVAATVAAQGQTPSSQRTTSVVGQLGLHDTAAAPTGTGATRELKCRGKNGIDLRVHADPSPRLPKLVTMALRYAPPQRTRVLAQEGMVSVDQGVSIAYLPGSCGWNPFSSPDVPPEPGIVYFDVPRDAQEWFAPESRDTTIDAAVKYPDVVSLPRYLSDPDRWWVFYVNDLTDVSISFGPLRSGIPTNTVASDPYSHDLATTRDHRTSDAGTRTAASTTTTSTVPVVDRAREPADTSRRVGSASTAANSAGNRTRTFADGREHGTTSVTRQTRSQPGGKGSTDARSRKGREITSGVTDVVAAPGPRGVRLRFTAAVGVRLFGEPARVQFAKSAPKWDDRERRWGYAPGWNSPWYATVRRLIGGSFEAVPFAKLESGARYHYLITIEEKGEPPRQRVGSFTATEGP